MNKVQMTLQEIDNKATKQGFELYLDTKEPDGRFHSIYTCIRGRYNGRVIDVYYNYHTEEVFEVLHSTQ